MFVGTPSNRQNVTLALPRELLREAKVVAAKRGMSLSALMVEALRRELRDDARYKQARTRIKDRLRKGFDLGTRGRPLPLRDDLHER